jgi:ribosomal protein L35AE/L33A
MKGKKMIKVDIRSKNSVYITIGKWVIYIDNSTGEYIIDSWKE